ncbi:hypothetical protein ABZ387_17605 [Streptomyces flaveolus]|uniref:hypothetical protein n=1 Tax=Streptomyces flaveolus TaxID=67297 RepID=UPI00340F35FE
MTTTHATHHRPTRQPRRVLSVGQPAVTDPQRPVPRVAAARRIPVRRPGRGGRG